MEYTKLQEKENELNTLQAQDNALWWNRETDPELLKKITKCRKEWHELGG